MKAFGQLTNPTRSGLSDNINTKGVMLVWGWKVLLALGHVHVELSKPTHCSWVLLTGVETLQVWRWYCSQVRPGLSFEGANKCTCRAE